MRLAWGGTVNIEYPKYSADAIGLLRDLGIDIPRLRKDFDFNWLGSRDTLKPALLFNEARYGRDVLLRGVTLDSLEPEGTRRPGRCVPALRRGAREAPGLPARGARCARGKVARRARGVPARHQLHGFPAPGVRPAGRGHPDLQQRALRLLGRAGRASLGRGGLWSGLPGAHVVGGGDEPGIEENDRDVAMFPDGNSSIARLLVRSLIPGSFPGMSADADPFGIVTARLDYGALDRSASPARLRLNSTAVHVANAADGAGVTVDYVNAAVAARLRAAGRARLLQRDHPLPRAGTAGGAEDRARAVREAADAGRQHRAAQRPRAREARHQGRPASRKLPAERFPGDRHQRRRLPPGLAAGGRLRDAVVRELRGATAGRRPREPGACRAGADAGHAVRRLRARSAPRAASLLGPGGFDA